MQFEFYALFCWQDDIGQFDSFDFVNASKRANFVARLDALTDKQVEVSALHPRLRQPMRTLDLAYFVAEHDDHHLARVTELLS